MSPGSGLGCPGWRRIGSGGAWLVTEYVHDPDGRFAGVVRQRRTLEAVSPDRMRVTQICEPGPELADHPMGAFAGRWAFELVKPPSRS